MKKRLMRIEDHRKVLLQIDVAAIQFDSRSV